MHGKNPVIHEVRGEGWASLRSSFNTVIRPNEGSHLSALPANCTWRLGAVGLGTDCVSVDCWYFLKKMSIFPSAFQQSIQTV